MSKETRQAATTTEGNIAFPFLEALVFINEQRRSVDNAKAKAGRKIKDFIIGLSGKMLSKYPDFPTIIDIQDVTNSTRDESVRHIIVFQAVTGQLMLLNRLVGTEEEAEGPDINGDRTFIRHLPREEQTEEVISKLSVDQWVDYGKPIVNAIFETIGDLDGKKQNPPQDNK